MAITRIKDVKYVRLEATGKYFIADQRWTDGVHYGQQWRDGYPYMLIHSGTVKPLEDVVYDVEHFLARWTRKPDFMFIIEARTRGQVKEYLVGEGLTTQFGGKMHWPNPQGGTFRVVPQAKGPVTEWASYTPHLPIPDEPLTRHLPKCAYAGLPIEQRGRLPWPADPDCDDMCVCVPMTPRALSTINANPAHNRSNKVNKDAMIKAEKAKIKQAKKKIEAIKSIPDEPEGIEEGPTIIQFQKRFSRGGRIYDYAAVKAGDGLWYTTGPHSPKGYTWDQLIRWIWDGQFGNDWSTVDGVWLVTELVPVI